jgi:threonylcarbamoyladenosine tRNA methylthiotransferase MtaB
VEQFTEKVIRCKKMVPDAAIGVDVVVGFPGETEEDFLKTYELLANLPITYFHVFPYSKRPGTQAAKMENQVPAKIKDERVAVLRKLDHKKRSAFYGSRIGKCIRCWLNLKNQLPVWPKDLPVTISRCILRQSPNISTG